MIADIGLSTLLTIIVVDVVRFEDVTISVEVFTMVIDCVTPPILTVQLAKIVVSCGKVKVSGLYGPGPEKVIENVYEDIAFILGFESAKELIAELAKLIRTEIMIKLAIILSLLVELFIQILIIRLIYYVISYY